MQEETFMSLVDPEKRSTLKTIAGAGVGIATGAFGIAATVNASSSRQPGTTSIQAFPPASIVVPDLEITIISSSVVSEDSLMLRNTTNEVMHIDNFRGGRIVFADKQLPLAEITAQGSIVLQPGQTISLQIPVRALETGDLLEYVWAESCSHRISNDCLQVILGGFVVDRSVIVFTAPMQSSLV